MAHDWLAIAWAQAWQITLLIAVVALPARWAGARRPHLAFVLWMLVLVKCLTPPLWSSPSGVFCWLQSPARSDSVSEPLQATSPGLAVLVGGEELQGNSARSMAEAACPEGQFTMDWRTCIAAVWIAGSVVVMTATAWQWWRLARRLRRAGVMREPAHEATVAALSRRLGLRRPARLALTEALVGPAALGLLRPALIVPQAVIGGKSSDDIELILAHELMHVRRGDGWFGLLRLLATTLWWFHPLVWWASRQASLAAERCCDEAVLAELKCSPVRYARCLLDVLDRRREMFSVPAFPGMRAMDVTRKRLERIMRIGQNGCRRTPGWCWGVAFLAAAMVLPGAAIGVSAGEETCDAKRLAESTSSEASPSSSAAVLGAKLPPPAAFEASAGPDGAEVRITKSYAVKDILAQIAKEQHLDAVQSREYLKRAIQTEIRVGQLVAGKKPSSAEALESQITCDKDAVTVHASPRQHQWLPEVLEAMRKCGTTSVVMSVRFITTPADQIQGIAWNAMPADLPASAAPNPDDGLAMPSLIDKSFGTAPRPNRSQTVVEKVSPLFYQVLSKKAGQELLDRLQSHRRTNVLQAPKVTAFSGQSVFVSDCSQSPAVVGVKDGKPQVRVVNEGTVLQLRSTANQGKLTLDFLATFAKIRRMEVASLSLSADKSLTGVPGTTIQVPEVATTRVEGTVELPWDCCLLLRGNEIPDSPRGQKTWLCLMIGVEKLSAHVGGQAAPRLSAAR